MEERGYEKGWSCERRVCESLAERFVKVRPEASVIVKEGRTVLVCIGVTRRHAGLDAEAP